MKKSLFTLLLCTVSYFPVNAYAVFVNYVGSGTMLGRNISMSMQIDNEIPTYSEWRSPDYYNKIGAHPHDMPLGSFAIGDYTIALEGSGTTSGTGGEFIIWWDLDGDRAVFYNDETILHTEETISGEFAHNRVTFMDGMGNPYDFSSWQHGDFQLPPEISFNNLNLGGWGGDARWSEVDLHLHAVPLPAAVWLFGAGLIGLMGIARRKSNHNLV
jgi:hypothetical protein